MPICAEDEILHQVNHMGGSYLCLNYQQTLRCAECKKKMQVMNKTAVEQIPPTLLYMGFVIHHVLCNKAFMANWNVCFKSKRYKFRILSVMIVIMSQVLSVKILFIMRFLAKLNKNEVNLTDNQGN